MRVRLCGLERPSRMFDCSAPREALRIATRLATWMQSTLFLTLVRLYVACHCWWQRGRCLSSACQAAEGGGGGGHQTSPRRVTPHPDPSWMLRLSEGASHETGTGKMLEEGP